MKKRTNHLWSLGFFILWLFLALACTMTPPDGPPCDELIQNYIELGYRPCQPIDPPITRQNTFVVTVRDRQTNLPLEGIYIKVIWTLFEIHLAYNCEKEFGCYARLDVSDLFDADIYEDFSNENGQIDGLTSPVTYTDKREICFMIFRVRDLKGKYSSTSEYLRFPYYAPSHGELTVYLQNLDQL